jgi:hypothetical protein
MAPTVLIQIVPRRTGEDEVEFVEELDSLVESSRCACNAGDDNPY